MKELEGEKNWGAWCKTPKETIKNYGTKKSKGTNKQTKKPLVSRKHLFECLILMIIRKKYYSKGLK